MKILFALLATMSFANIAIADCTYGGQNYTTGDIVNGYVCTENGTWENT